MVGQALLPVRAGQTRMSAPPFPEMFSLELLTLERRGGVGAAQGSSGVFVSSGISGSMSSHGGSSHPGGTSNFGAFSGPAHISVASSFQLTSKNPATRKLFVPLTGAANVPVGSQLDTSKGRIQLTSASDTAGVKTQSSDFYDGIFQVKQSVPKKKPKKPKALVTDLVMKGQIARSRCAPLKGARSAAADAKKKKGPKSVLGRLWGNGKGKFRTSGKYSSATVRGTIWQTVDRCDGTLTIVKRGTVSVRDIKRRKTITVKAGHSYLARARR